MIKVRFKSNKLTVEGHAGYSTEGSDIVCSAVSTLITTTINAILTFDEKAIEYESEKGLVSIDILKKDDTTKKLIDNCMNLLEQLVEDYPKYIKIERE